MNEATKLCDNIALLYQGEIIEYGAPKDIINKYADDNKVVITFQNGKEIRNTVIKFCAFKGPLSPRWQL